MVADEPRPTLPHSCDAPVTFKDARLASPVVFKVDRAAAEVTVNDPPTPTLPTVVKVFKVVLPETARVEVPTEPKMPAEVALTDPPTPTLPVTDKDEPTPTKPEKYPVPKTLKL